MMDYKDEVNEEYLEDLKEKIKDIIIRSQEGFSFTSWDLNGISDLVDDWYSAKRFFIDLFKGRTIVEIPLDNIGLNDNEQSREFSQIIDRCKYTYNGEEDLVNFLSENKYNFFENRVKKLYTTKDKNTIPSGMKITKALKYFTKDFNLIQEDMSRVLQKNKIGKGILCFSVHPLDFLTSSLNNHNWESCHNLFDGQYKAGNLSYMRDNSTIICYLKNEEDNNDQLLKNGIRWNSKKWRILLYASQNGDMVLAGRQYPYSSSSLLKAIQENWEKITEEEWTSWEEGHPYQSYRGEFEYINKNLKVSIKDGDLHPTHYNDLLFSSTYTSPYYMLRKNCPTVAEKFIIGSPTLCVCCGNFLVEEAEGTLLCNACDSCYNENQVCEYCGQIFSREEIIYIKEEDLYVCEDCFDENYFHCEKCGYIQRQDDGIVTTSGDLICQDCFDNHYFVCDCCGEILPISEINSVSNNGDEEIVCPDCCINNYVRCESCGTFFSEEDGNYNSQGEFCCNDCKIDEKDKEDK